MARPGTNTRVYLLVLAATLFWPLQEGFGGVLMRSHHAAQVVALRYIAHLLLMGIVVLPRHGLRAFATTRPGLQLLRGLCMFGMPAGFILAVGNAGIGWIWTVFWLMPAIALAGALLLSERPGLTAWGAALVAPFAAAAIWEAVPGGVAGTAAALLMGGSFAAYVVLSRVLREEKLIASLFYTAVGALLPMSLFVWPVWTPVTGADIVPALITGLLSLLILGAFDLATEAAPVSAVAPLIPLVLVWEMLLGALRHTRPMFTADIAGMTLILAATLVFVARNRVQRRVEREAA
jgi:drug/metabolite transporter (DMT)-like permease